MITEELETVSVEKHINTELKRFDKIEAEIARLTSEYKDLKINGPEDKDGYEMVKNAWRHLRDARLTAEKEHKAVTEDALKFKQAIDGKLRQIKDGLKPMEDDFYKQWKEEDGRKEREKEAARLEAERIVKERNEGRRKALFALGLTWNGANYAHALPGILSVSEAEVTGLDDGPFEELITNVSDAAYAAKLNAEKEEAARIEAQRIQKEEADKQAAIAAENERAALELAERQAQFDARINESRLNELTAIGADVNEMPMGPFARYSDVQWTDEVRQVKLLVERRKEQEAKAAQEAEQERIKHEQRIRDEAAEAERQRAAKEAEEIKRKEEERLLQAGDLGAIETITAKLNDIITWTEGHAFKSAIAKQGMSVAMKHLTNALTVIEGTAKDLK